MRRTSLPSASLTTTEAPEIVPVDDTLMGGIFDASLIVTSPSLAVQLRPTRLDKLAFAVEDWLTASAASC